MKKKKEKIGSYDNIAAAYAKTVDVKPIHVYYERPATLSLLPGQLKGLKILDMGCGSGWYAEHLVNQGADLTAIDASQVMVDLTRKRLKNKGNCFVANLEDPLPFKDKEFDIVLAPLVIHYIRDWQPLFKEIARVLKSQGIFIFSTHQMHTEAINFNIKNYYEKRIVHDYWEDVGEVSFYHHTLHELGEALYQSRFVIERLLEPKPLPEMKEKDPKMYGLITQRPWFLFVRAMPTMKGK